MPASTPRTKFRYPFESQPMCVQSNRVNFDSSPRNNNAASAGDRVNALNNEIAIENAIVSENCRYRMPVVPGKKETGTKTEIRTSEVATTALATSAMAADVAACGSA